MSKIDHAKRNEVGILQRELRQVNTYSGSDGDHAGSGAESIQLGVLAGSTGTRSIAFGYGALGSDYGAIAIGVGAEAALGTAIGGGAQALGDNTIAIGDFAVVSGIYSLAVGFAAEAPGNYSVAVGINATASHSGSVAIGSGSATTADDQVMVGADYHTVVVPGDLTVAGTFSNPSARHLKENITPAPDLGSVFPDLNEYEYIGGDGRRRLGYIADELVGTDAERFVQFDAEGRPVAIDYLGLLVAQVAVLSARVSELEGR